MAALLENNDFKKAVGLSGSTIDELPNVTAFNDKVINAFITYIDGYVLILQKCHDNESLLTAAKLDKTKLGIQIAALNSIKATIEDPLKKYR